MADNLEVINIPQWIKDNQEYFLPPVCNKMIHNKGQMKGFFVGGPNVRKDYHLEEGEEFFFMRRGDMCLKVVDAGVHRDIHIREGEVFLLPGNVIHSPQRIADTVGLVIERERLPQERDGLIYFVEKDGKPTLERLYEKYFYCQDLGTQLKPVIEGYFASEQHRTGKPIPEELVPDPPVVPNPSRRLRDPFKLSDWLAEHCEELDKEGSSLALFRRDPDEEKQFTVDVLGLGTTEHHVKNAEVWLWVLEGNNTTVKVEQKSFNLKKDDSLLIAKSFKFSVTQSLGSRLLVCYQQPRD